ncbi:MAG: hydrogenase expression/formation protein HypE [Gammaproteobacteria bacterium]|nr:hydrogenase expression/formation protein HypE [Gammaproteobacteria bacterium]
MSADKPPFEYSCPVPASADTVQLDHGGGGQLAHQLLHEVILPRFANEIAASGHDSAMLDLRNPRVAFTTDSFVVNPLEFPGGDIGKLAVFGTVNDLLMAGALPRHISCSLIIEEGLPLAVLRRILQSMATAAGEAGVTIVTGDTKVVERGHGDGLFINTAGIGERIGEIVIAPQSIRAGDCILLSGDIARHGIAVLAQREGMRFDAPVDSDCASLLPAVSALLDENIEVHCLRDATRGGLATILLELAEISGLCFAIDEERIPVADAVRGACELLGLDPLYIANEGCFVAIVPAAQAERALAVMRAHSVSEQSVLIGQVSEGAPALMLNAATGTRRQLRRLTGQPLPRIC